jgi:hypothetical protein
LQNRSLLDIEVKSSLAKLMVDSRMPPEKEMKLMVDSYEKQRAILNFNPRDKL